MSFGGSKVPPPPPIPPPPKIPSVKDQDMGKLMQQRSRAASRNSTILGGYSGTDANVNKPSLLGQ